MTREQIQHEGDRPLPCAAQEAFRCRPDALSDDEKTILSAMALQKGEAEAGEIFRESPEHLRDYTILKGVNSYAALGRYYLATETTVPEELYEYMDLGALGCRYEDEHPGVFIGSDYVCYAGLLYAHLHCGHPHADPHLDGRAVRMMKHTWKKRSGEGYIDTCVLILCAMLVIALAVKVLPVYVAKQQLDTFAAELVREAEITGRVGSETTSRAQVLSERLEIDPDIRWSRTGRIQLNEEVTVTLTLDVDIGFGGLGSFPIELTAQASGRSEVYWK